MTEPRPGVDPATSTADVDLVAKLREFGNQLFDKLDARYARIAWNLAAEVGRLRADLADARRANDRVWQVVQVLRNRAFDVSGDAYSDPVSQALSAALVGHEDFDGLLAALSAEGTDQTEGDEQ